MRSFYLMDWISVDKQKTATLYARYGKWIASDYVAEIKDSIYIIPTIKFYFNHSDWYVGCRWLTFRIDFVYKNYQKHDEYMKKILRRRYE